MMDLIVGGYGLRNLPVGDKSDSGFVNSHPEADCRSYHRHLRKSLIWPAFKVHLSIHPVFLNFVPVGIFEPSMIGKAGNFSFRQCHCQTLTNFPATLRLSDSDIFFSSFSTWCDNIQSRIHWTCLPSHSASWVQGSC